MFLKFFRRFKKHKENWGIYKAWMDDLPAIVAVDLQWRNRAPLWRYDVLHTFSIQYNDFISEFDRLPSPDESDKLHVIEDHVIHALKEKSSALYVGRITNDAARTHFFYLKSPKNFQDIIDPIIANFSDYQYATDWSEDPKWRFYFDFLFPNDDQLDNLTNGRVLIELQEKTNSPLVSRAIDHWIFFKTEMGRMAFILEMEQEGFEVDQTWEELQKPYPYRLHLVRQDLADEKSMASLTQRLAKSAEKHQGLYDGWGKVVVE